MPPSLQALFHKMPNPGSEEVVELFPNTKSGKDINPTTESVSGFFGNKMDHYSSEANYGDSGSAARFFYCAKAGKKERTANGQVENKHPTVKPLKLMEYLCKLVSMPEGNLLLDPFCGSGSTLVACKQLGLNCVGIDEDPKSVATALRRLKHTKRNS